jgi:hypothetical protein
MLKQISCNRYMAVSFRKKVPAKESTVWVALRLADDTSISM